MEVVRGVDFQILSVERRISQSEKPKQKLQDRIRHYTRTIFCVHRPTTKPIKTGDVFVRVRRHESTVALLITKTVLPKLTLEQIKLEQHLRRAYLET